MKFIDIPTKVETPFADDADPSFVTPIPQTTTTPGRASFTAGFPPANFMPIAAGGIPPFGQDMNGLLNQISAWTRWQSAGAIVKYDADFSAEISGYPSGAMLFATAALGFWISLVDDNTSNPDAAGANWVFLSITQVFNGDPNTHVAGRAASSTGAPSTLWDTLGSVMWICTTTGNAASAVWRPLPILKQITMQTGAARNYIASDVGRVYVRSNGGSAMTDTLPDGTTENGWNVTIVNGDPTAVLTINAPASRRLNGVLADSLLLVNPQSVEITSNSAHDFWITVQPEPRLFSGQAVYVNASATLGPGVYDIDTRLGPFTITLEAAPVLGDNYQFRDVGGALSRNNCSIDPNNDTIRGSTMLYPLDLDWSDSVISFIGGDWELT